MTTRPDPPGAREERIERIAEALRRADYMNWTAREVAEKIDGTVAALAQPGPRETGLREALRHILVEYNRTHLRHDVAYADVADAIDKARALTDTEVPGSGPETP